MIITRDTELFTCHCFQCFVCYERTGSQTEVREESVQSTKKETLLDHSFLVTFGQFLHD